MIATVRMTKESPGGGTPKLCQEICLLNIYWYHKQLAL